MENSLTICSVSYNSAHFLRLNLQITKKLNPGARIQWIIAENSPSDSSDRLPDNEPEAKIIEGSGPGHIPIYHHTLALQRCVERAESRFVLVIDPDLYVVRRNWINDAVTHMIENKLAILGVPWHPQSKSKYRYFPAVHFSMFDTTQFPKTAIDFRPDVPDGEDDPHWEYEAHQDQKYFYRSRAANWLSKIPPLRHRRRRYTDTGSRLYKRWVGDPTLCYEVLDPIWDPQANVRHKTLIGNILEHLLPDELCYEPKHYSRLNQKGFLDANLGKAAQSNWEQFAWKDAPFCFHVRLNLKRGSRNTLAEIEAVRNAVEKLASRCGEGNGATF